MEHKDFKFPDHFLWGAGSSSHQVEGDNRNNDWWEWEERGMVKERSGLACDHWNRFREDFALAKSLHHNAHRFSLEWSRIEPEEGRFDEGALNRYREMIESLRSNGLEPIVTLHHFTLPIWFAKKGGWLYGRSPELFARYAERAYRAIGQGVRYWMTINEPVVHVFKSYFIGDWPPGERSYEKCVRALIHFLKAHVLAYDAMHLAAKRSGDTIQAGIAKHAAVFAPCSKQSWKDRLSVWIRNRLFNHLFVDALIRGRAFFPGLFNVRLTRAKTLDFIGLNYYTRHFVQNAGFKVPEIFGDICTLKHHRDVGTRNFMGWEIYPQGLYRLVKEFAKHRLPILISENGICTNRDEERTQFIKDHLDQTAQCLEEKIPIIGYLYWSLLDNYEWADGYLPRFGLVEVDYKTQARTVRPSAREFAEICRTGIVRGA